MCHTYRNIFKGVRRTSSRSAEDEGEEENLDAEGLHHELNKSNFKVGLMILEVGAALL